MIYGSSTGNTKNVAEMLKDALGNVDYLKNVTEITPADFSVPENIILGIPTWHIGELQDDWAAMLPMIEQVNPNVTGKKLAIFGLGDAKGYPDTYVDAIQMLWEPFEKRGAKLFGYWPTKGYEFQKSKALKGDKFMGLVIDIENQDNLSDSRVKAWATQIKGEMGL
ncbi:MAG: flavodoxin [Deltaproteobacteria bacterium]|nr:flavodoxin [Deltaproteobacteria bacterium]MBI3293411.1 flavodoxin [Deltaproteobacteria bacterium]